MELRAKLQAATKEAMKSKDSARLSTLRLISAAMKDREIAARAGDGDGTLTDRPAPTRVNGLSDVGAVSTGERTTCALASSYLWCWGFNATGQLGVGGTDDRLTPTQVTF